MSRLTVGAMVSKTGLVNIKGAAVAIPKPGQLTHLQFRRFAGCPICNLHLQSFFKRADELQTNNIHEVIVFHASKEKMLESVVDVPFDLIADPSRTLYQAFGVESSWKALLSWNAMKNGMKGMKKFGLKTPQSLEAELGLPADFLIDENGTIVALKYGEHADDQWSVDTLLDLSKSKATA